MRTSFSISFHILVLFNLCMAASLFERQDDVAFWDEQADKNLVAGCSAAATKCYEKHKLASCDVTDYECKCDAMKSAVDCLADCETLPVAEGQKDTECKAADIYSDTPTNDSDSSSSKGAVSSSRDSDENNDEGDGESSAAVAPATLVTTGLLLASTLALLIAGLL